MAFTRNWDESFPPDTQPANLLGQDIRDFKEDIRERVAAISGDFTDRPAVGDMITGWGAYSGNGMLYFATDTGAIYQWDGAAWVEVTNFFSVHPAGFNNITLAGQSGSIATTLLYAVPIDKPGRYRISVYLNTELIGAAGTLQFVLGWNDGISVKGSAFGSLMNLDSNDFMQTTVVLSAIASTNINYAINQTDGIGALYQVGINLDFLGI